MRQLVGWQSRRSRVSTIQRVITGWMGFGLCSGSARPSIYTIFPEGCSCEGDGSSDETFAHRALRNLCVVFASHLLQDARTIRANRFRTDTEFPADADDCRP